jgi:LysM repeat protein
MADAERQRSRTRRSLAAIATVPIVLVGAVAALRWQKRGSDSKAASGPKHSGARAVEPVVMARPLPPAIKDDHRPAQQYQVELGDTISEIATRHGLPTADVLARNGLSWKTPIFPGQILSLTGPLPIVVEPEKPHKKKAARAR